MTYQIIQGSAHKTGLPAKSVHVAVTSPPYFGLRAYDGDQGIEWPGVEYSPLAGLPAITIKGCEPGCDHQWADAPVMAGRGGQSDFSSSTLKRDGRPEESRVKTLMENAKELKRATPKTGGAYCVHCGGWRGPLGLEPTIEAYIGHLILVLREMRRVLRDDGTLWFNIGSSYAGSQQTGGTNSISGGGVLRPSGHSQPQLNVKRSLPVGLKPKDDMLIPSRFALAAQADGWYIRSAMPWVKRNPMPESTKDRPNTVVEWIYLLVKSEDYYFDMEAVKQPITESSINRNQSGWNGDNQRGYTNGDQNHMSDWMGSDKAKAQSARHLRALDAFFKTWQGLLSNEEGDPLAMVINPVSYKGSHFATFPPLLPEIAIKAGSSQRGACAKCGAPWERLVEREAEQYNIKEGVAQALRNQGAKNGGTEKVTLGVTQHVKVNTTGWQPSCTCDGSHDPIIDDEGDQIGRLYVPNGAMPEPIPCTVLDPFAGSGTTLRVALALGRRPVGVDISDKYITELVPERTSNVQMAMMF